MRISQCHWCTGKAYFPSHRFSSLETKLWPSDSESLPATSPATEAGCEKSREGKKVEKDSDREGEIKEKEGKIGQRQRATKEKKAKQKRRELWTKKNVWAGTNREIKRNYAFRSHAEKLKKATIFIEDEENLPADCWLPTWTRCVWWLVWSPKCSS